MASNAQFIEIAALAGDPARAAMLHALMDGRALTATELASIAGIAPQTASGHLSRLLTAGLLGVERQGRHRYPRLASRAVAQMMESIMQVASEQKGTRRAIVTGPRDMALRTARTCYDHLAGRLGVRRADARVARKRIELSGDAGVVTSAGIKFFSRIGMDARVLENKGTRRVLCRPCLDWSERRPHLAGSVGAALCAHCLDNGWVRRMRNSRAVEITPKGMRAFREEFGFRMD